MSPTLRYAIAFSLIFHMALAAYLFATRGQRRNQAKLGTISVDFIQSVEHHEDPPKEQAEHGGERTAKKEAAPTPAPRQSQPVGDPNTVARESDLYIHGVTKLINVRKIYPQSAIEREEEGRVVIGVSLDREGNVLATKIEEPSPFASLNEAAAATIKAVGRFPPLPDSVTEPMHLHIPLIFKIERR